MIFESDAIAVYVPIYTAETLLARNPAPFAAISLHLPGTRRSKPSHLRPNVPAPNQTAFYTRLSIRQRTEVRRAQGRKGQAYYRTEYAVARYMHAVCVIDWRTAQIEERRVFAAKDEALSYLNQL